MAVSGTSSSISSALGVTGKGIGGLATGLNTDELVGALTSGTKLKIAKQGQQKQLLNWKINAYRSMSTALTAFQTKFLKTSTSAASNTNIMSSRFFNTYKATSSSDKVSVSATSGSQTGNFTIDQVKQLATSESYTSTNKMSAALNLDIKSENIKEGMFTGQTLRLEAKGFDDKNIKLDDLNQYVIKTANPDTLDEDGKATADTTYTYSLDMAGFKDGLQTLMNKAYNSNGFIKVDNDGGNITLNSNATITLGSTNTLLGLDAGDSNRVDTGMKIGDLDAFKNVQGDVLTFNINGVEISVNKRDDIDTLLDKVTNSGADVRMDYDEYNDVFTLTSKKYGANSKFEISDVQGNLMSELFGAKGGNGVGTDYLTTGDDITIGTDFLTKMVKMSTAEKKALGEKLSNMTFELTVNGETKNVRLDTALISSKLTDGTFSAEDVYGAINRGIKSAFPKAGIEFSLGEGNKTQVSSSLGEAFQISTTANSEFAKLLGLSASGTNYTAGNAITSYGYSGKINSDNTANSPIANYKLDKDGVPTDEKTGFINAEKIKGGESFQMTINGVTKDIVIDPGKNADGTYKAVNNDNFLSLLNSAVQEAFGEDAKGVNFSATYEKMDGYAPVIDPATDFVKKEDGYYNKDGKKIYDLPPEGVNPETGDPYPDGYYNKDGKRVIDAEGYLLNSSGERVANFQKNSGVKLTLNVPANSLGVVETSVSMNGALSEAMGFKPEAANISNAPAAIKLGDLKGGKDMAEGAITVKIGETVATVAYKSTDTLEDFLTELNSKLGDSGAAGIKDGKLFITSEDGDLTITDRKYEYVYEPQMVDDGEGNMVPAEDEDGNPILTIAKDEDGNPKLALDDDDNPIISSNAGSILENMFGIKGGEYKTAAEDYTSKFATEDVLDENGEVIGQKAASSHKEAQNALLTIDGKDIEWSSNTVSYNNVNLTLHDVSTEAIKIGVQSDPEDVIKRITEWMDDYNALVYTLNSSVNEGKNRNYEPLTDEQKADMTEEQIKTWETEAKKGLLRNDQTLKQILADMRNSLYEKVESAGISLYDIGIVTKSGLSDMNQAGQLEFDTNVTGGGEQRLREMLTNNPDSVRMLFTDSENGIGTKLNKIISQAANPSSVDRGTLVRLAGTEQLTGDNTSQLGNKIAALDKFITSLKLRLETEHSRYWKQFSRLETSVQKMNTQSSWLQSQ